MFDDTNRKASFDAGLVAGIAIGAAIALLYAPMRGEDLRRRLDTSLRRVRDDVARRYTQIERDVREQVDQVQRALDEVGADFKAARRRLIGEPATSRDS